MQHAYAKNREKLKPCSPPSFSFFSLIETLWRGSKTPSNPLHRFCTLMRKMKAKGFIQEELLPNQELNDEIESATRRCKGEVLFKSITRLTFFVSCPSDWNNAQELPDDHLIGYAVVVSLKLPDSTLRTYLHEAVIRPPSVVFVTEQNQLIIEPVTNYYVHNFRKFETSVGPCNDSRTFSIEGSFFTQQNDLTCVCAHAALRMAINSSPIFGSSKLTNKFINDTLNLDFNNPRKQIGHYSTDASDAKEGVNTEEIQVVVEALGGRIHRANFSENTCIEYDHFVYPLLESSCPTILGIEGWDVGAGRPVAHVVSALGHTSNTDRWDPEARSGYGNYPIMPYIPVSSWCCHYIISDDNYGMYVTLPSDMIRNFVVPSKNPCLHAVEVLGIVPEDVNLTGYASEQVAMRRGGCPECR
jgi:hypothetical protein